MHTRYGSRKDAFLAVIEQDRGVGVIDECDVWWVDPRSTTAEYVDLLDTAERARYQQPRFAADRARFLTGAALLRLVAGQAVGVRPENVAVDRSCPTCDLWHGRPRLPGVGVHVSVTHSGDRVGVALTRSAPVGLDVELVDERRSQGLAAAVLGDGEHADTADDFFRYWTRKESVVKATGDGIVVGLTKVRVTPPDEPPQLLGYPRQPVPAATMRDLAPGDGYMGAVTVLSATELVVHERLLATLSSELR
jgi:4'-phosphopantetheinyl transferase